MQNILKISLMFIFIIFLFTINVNMTKKVSGEMYHEYTVYIDPGHGGIDGGASGNDLVEKDINLKVALYLRNLLEDVGINVLLTRDDDIDYYGDTRGSKKRADLLHRIDMINHSEADLYVSIHMNKIGDSRWFGSQVFYYPGNPHNKYLAERIQQNLKDILGTHREAKSIKNLFLFKHCDKPGVLVEAGFLSNPREANLLKQPAYQEKVAYSIYIGIIEYLNEKNNL